MTPQEVAKLWAEYMSALMKQLSVVKSGEEAGSRAETRISELLHEAHFRVLWPAET